MGSGRHRDLRIDRDDAVKRWSFSEDAYLAANFDSATMAEMIAATGRTKDAIYSRAKVLKIHRENRGRIGHGRYLVGTPFRPGSIPHKTSLRDTVIAELVKHKERTTRQLCAATGSKANAIWKTCDYLRKQGNLHTVRFQPCDRSVGNFVAVYRIGAGVDAVMPVRKKEPEPNPHEIQPIPRPKLGAWGCVWNTTPPASPAERNAA